MNTLVLTLKSKGVAESKEKDIEFEKGIDISLLYIYFCQRI